MSALGNEVCLITGAGPGIGRAPAVAFAKAGAGQGGALVPVDGGRSAA
ncbi:hypothetical protein ACFPOI_37650 [Nonomuraea angiospora]|uniref:NAD(P)-dependent dehydrogenase (Short-subunit alcohol dehydrogenase family) n=1 Tax=Nonomuraea angiospora TaxID=46172 RepID=A0ABR9M0W6_9ACTN|nr:hypothetical protein [Nonomuraea angiospora]MBE1586549.1 NAD(P)-dependent dehydrogenase (short-subunit alcohol dehydrogenase family) [Nonomuraea angiospora]